RFFTVAAAAGEQRDWSTQSRLDLWRDCLDCLVQNPLFGCGPGNWGETAVRYGWPPGKSAHTTWLEVAAELGGLGLLFLALFYAVCVRRLWPVVREATPASDPWMRTFARMTIAAVIGFAISAQFVSVAGLEAPYYIVLLGAGVLKLESLHAEAEQAGDRED